MNNKVLKKLRKKARKDVTLIPWKFDGPNIVEVVVSEKNDIRGYTFYHYRKKCYDGGRTYIYIYEDTYSTDKEHISYGYSLEEGLEKLKECRRYYILFLLECLRIEKNEEREYKRYQKAKKELERY